MILDKRPELTDELLRLYCDWRTRCEDVRATYERFANSPRGDRAVAFAAFQAALDREECAADAYAEQLGRLPVAA